MREILRQAAYGALAAEYEGIASDEALAACLEVDNLTFNSEGRRRFTLHPQPIAGHS